MGLLLYLQVFFCKYNDPIYVKMEKLEIMIKLASDRNIDQVSFTLYSFQFNIFLPSQFFHILFLRIHINCNFVFLKLSSNVISVNTTHNFVQPEMCWSFIMCPLDKIKFISHFNSVLVLVICFGRFFNFVLYFFSEMKYILY